MLIKENIVINGSCKRDILIDTTQFKTYKEVSKVIIFSHGFKGFKDWGPFNKIAEYFASFGFLFVKFNFSHNGTSLDKPTDFVDLDAFGNNNFCKELDDLQLVISWVRNNFPTSIITLFGHSRGGAISIIKSIEDKQISNIVSWASPSNFLCKLPVGEKAKKWKETNVAYIYNGRTKQNMPLFYQFYENCINNKDRLNIMSAVKKIKIPHLHVHGDADPTVLIDDAHNLKKWNPRMSLHIIKKANHVFGSFHPYHKKTFPDDLNKAINITKVFLEGK